MLVSTTTSSSNPHAPITVNPCLALSDKSDGSWSFCSAILTFSNNQTTIPACIEFRAAGHFIDAAIIHKLATGTAPCGPSLSVTAFMGDQALSHK